MRTFPSVALAFIAATLIAPSAGAQRHSRRVSRSGQLSPSATTRPANSATVGCADDCDDYSLSIISAVLPADAPSSGPEYVTVVIENQGKVASPASMVMVAPKNHLSLVRQSGIRSLAPGERATVQLPVEIGPDGTPCVSITIRSAPIAPPAHAAFLAAAQSVPQPSVTPRVPASLTSGIQWAGVEDRGFVPTFDPFPASIATPYDVSDLGVA